ncbi:MAG: molybdopterin-guanine dinucleotide biosynthesis protein B [Actinomycetota bacterium]
MSERHAKLSEPSGPPLISVVAPSGTGKTTLMEGVIGRLNAAGHRVGVVKHDAHRIELDTEGKDSWRLRAAGAAGTVLMGRDQLAFFGTEENTPDLQAVAALLFADMDLVLVEGFRAAGLPSIVVTRPGHKDEAWEPPDPDRVLLTATSDEVDRVVAMLRDRYLTG